MQLLTPEATVTSEGEQDRTFRLHQASGKEGHQLQKTTEIGETAQRKSQRGKQFLIAALLAIEAVNQLPQ